MDFVELQNAVYVEYIKNGYLAKWKEAYPEEIADIAELGLICSEVAEAMEKVRDREGISEELADIVIRVMNYASRHGIELQLAIVHKHKVNIRRPERHGRKFF